MTAIKNETRTSSMRSLCILLFLLLAACAPARAERTAVTVPFSMASASVQAPLVTVRLNGTDVHMLADTGTTNTLITREAMMRIGASSRKIIVPSDPGDPKRTTADAAHIDTIQIGSLRFGNSDFQVANLGEISDLAPGVDGILGWSFWQQVAAQFDFTTDRLTMWYGGKLTPAERQAVGMADATPAKVSLAPGAMAFAVDAAFHDGVTVPMIVDTGSPSTFIPPPVAARLGAEPLTQILRFGVSGPVRMFGANVPEFSIAGVKLGPTGLYISAGAAPRAGTLGLDVLRRVRWILDAPGNTAFFKEPIGQAGKLVTADWKIYHIPQTTRTDQRLPVVQLTLADGKEHWFALGLDSNDTIDREVAKSLHLPETPVPGSPAEQVGLLMSVGSVPFGTFPFLSVGKSGLPGNGEGYDGVLGIQFLERAGVRLVPGGSSADLIVPGASGSMPVVGKGWYDVPLSSGVGGPAAPPLASVRYGGVAATVAPTLISNGSVIVGADDTAALDSEGSTALLFGPLKLRAVRVKELRMGDALQTGSVVILAPPVPGMTSNLGLEFLRAFEVYFDGPVRMLYLKRVASAQPMEYSRWQGTGIALFQRAEHGITVKAVLDPSPASEAGIRPGDQIIEVDGTPPGGLALGDLERRLWSDDAGTTALDVEHSGASAPVHAVLTRKHLL